MNVTVSSWRALPGDYGQAHPVARKRPGGMAGVGRRPGGWTGGRFGRRMTAWELSRGGCPRAVRARRSRVRLMSGGGSAAASHR